MKHKCNIILLCSMCGVVNTAIAQNEILDMKNTFRSGQAVASDSLFRVETGKAINRDIDKDEKGAMLQPYSRNSYFNYINAEQDSLHLPLLTMRGQMPLMNCPYATWWGLDTWQLHKGLNMNLGASVFASFGKGAPKGAGFAQDISLMYAMPLSKRVSLAVGGWVSNAYWAHDRFTDAGLSAVLGYKIDDHWEAYVYGRKSIMNKPLPYRFATMQELGDRIGAAVKYNFSPSFSVQLSVEAVDYKMPNSIPESLNNGMKRTR